MKALVVALAVAAFMATGTPLAHADDVDPAALFTQGTQALHEGRASDAITAFESLADLGVTDPVASYDRGLAYALRIRVGGEVPGDLGRAAHGFEEARDATRDPRLADDASRALTILRSEVARRRTAAGESVEVDPGRSLASTVAGLLSEDAWALLAAVSSALLWCGLFVRWRNASRRVRIGAGVTSGLAAPALVAALAMTLLSRHDRLALREAIVVSPSARPTDERGVVAPAATPLPEGARVEIVEEHAALSRFRFGRLDGWIPTSSLRELAL